jgi:hypothetical protein
MFDIKKCSIIILFFVFYDKGLYKIYVFILTTVFIFYSFKTHHIIKSNLDAYFCLELIPKTFQPHCND